MDNKMVIKEVSDFMVEENGKSIHKSKLIISNNGVDTEIILEGNGKVKVSTAV